MSPTDHRNGNACERKYPAVRAAIGPRSEPGQLGELPGARGQSIPKTTPRLPYLPHSMGTVDSPFFLG